MARSHHSLAGTNSQENTSTWTVGSNLTPFKTLSVDKEPIGRSDGALSFSIKYFSSFMGDKYLVSSLRTRKTSRNS